MAKLAQLVALSERNCEKFGRADFEEVDMVDGVDDRGVDGVVEEEDGEVEAVVEINDDEHVEEGVVEADEDEDDDNFELDVDKAVVAPVNPVVNVKPHKLHVLEQNCAFVSCWQYIRMP